MIYASRNSEYQDYIAICNTKFPETRGKEIEPHIFDKGGFLTIYEGKGKINTIIKVMFTD